MASSSSSHQPNRESNAFSGIEPAGERRKVSESSSLFDVFINHRGPDVKQTLATELYNSLRQLNIVAFLDSEEKELGILFTSTIETAIRSAKVHIAIFSKGYAESPWCLAELVLMLQSEAKIIPVFYQVKPSDLRHIEKGAYADAFREYEKKGRYLKKLSEWKEALNQVSVIAGVEFDSSSDCKTIVAAVEKEVQQKRCLYVAKHPVGLDNLVKDFEKRCLDEIVEDFENQCGLEARKNKPNVVGIFGMGGVGKTTLAKELFNRKRSEYSGASFMYDVREASVRGELPRLQSQLVKDLLHREESFRSIEEGKTYLNDHLQRSPPLNFLIVVDDIDHVEQLDALLMVDILNKLGNSLVIVTTRDVGVVISAGITFGYPLKGMDRNIGRQLFCWHAFGQPCPCAGYEALVEQFVDVCGGLPLSLLVLGRLVHGRDRRFWELKLTKARETVPLDVKQRLRISFDALDDEEKQVFLDVACFFLGKFSWMKKMKYMAERILEGSGWNAQNALQTLQDKCFIEEIHEYGEPVLRMHDHLRDLGREMALELSPPHRLWRPQDLKSLESMGLQTILTKTDVRCFHEFFDYSMGCRVTFFLGQSDSCVATSASLLWLVLGGAEQSMIPSYVPLQNLQYLEISGGRFKTLWENRRQIFPYQRQLSGTDGPLKLRELRIIKCPKLKELPCPSRLSCLEKIEIEDCDKLQNITLPIAVISLFVSSCRDLRRLSGTDGPLKLRELIIITCPKLKELPCPSRLSCLEKIEIEDCHKLQNITLPTALISLFVSICWDLRRLSGTDGPLKLRELRIIKCPKLEELPCPSRLSCLEKIEIGHCEKLQNITLPTALISLFVSSCRDLRRLSGTNGPLKLRELRIITCPKLKELPCPSRLSCLEKIEIKNCDKLQNITLPTALISLFVSRCWDLQRLSGTDGLIKLRELTIIRCPELEELSCPSRLSCLEKIEIKDCHKLQNITLPTAPISLFVIGCWGLRRLSGTDGPLKLRELRISYCDELEELPCPSRLSCLEKIEIGHCEKLQNITLPTTLISLFVSSCRDLRRLSGTDGPLKLRELRIIKCPKLKELPCPSRLSCLEKIEIEDCERLQNVTLPTALISLFVSSCRDLWRLSGTDGPLKLRELRIIKCPKLKELPCPSRLSCLEKIEIEDCDKLQNITLPTAVISLFVSSCRDLRRLSGTDGPLKLRELRIINCPELEELPCLSRLSCSEKIEIVSCDKLQNITLPTTLISLSVHGCRDLQRVAGYGDPTKLTELIISNCPELEELGYIEESPSVSRMTCMKTIDIDCCEKLEKILIAELCSLQRIRLRHCGNALIRNCIHDLKSAPSESVYMIGRAVNGAESKLNKDLFCDANIEVEIGTPETNIEVDSCTPETNPAVIRCFLVIVDSSTKAEDINRSIYWPWPKVREGEWIITIVDNGKWKYNFNYEYVEDVFRSEEIIKTGLWVPLKKGEEWKSLSVLRIIADRLYQ